MNTHLVAGERRVSHKDVIQKGQLLAEGVGGQDVRGEVRGIYWRELAFPIQLADPEDVVMKNCHLHTILEKFMR